MIVDLTQDYGNGPDGYVVSVDGFGIVFIDIDTEGMEANVRVYDGFDHVADHMVSLTKDRQPFATFKARAFGGVKIVPPDVIVADQEAGM